MKKYLSTLICLVSSLAGHNAMAALAATVYASPTTAIINQPVGITVGVYNDTSAVTLQNVVITASYNGSTTSRIPMALSQFGPATVAIAVGTTGTPVTTQTPAQNVVFFAPSTGITGSGSGKYYVGALLYFSDGTVTSAATSAQVTVNPVPLPAYERQ